MGDIASLLPLVQGLSSGAQGYSGFRADIAQGGYQRRIQNANAQLAQTQAGEATAAGEIAASRTLQAGAQAASSQRASMAAQGVNVDSPSAALVQTDISNAAAQDAATLRHNAALESWGYGVNAIDAKGRGRMGYLAGRNAGTQSGIAGGMQFMRYGLAAADNEGLFKRPSGRPTVPFTMPQWYDPRQAGRPPLGEENPGNM